MLDIDADRLEETFEACSGIGAIERGGASTRPLRRGQRSPRPLPPRLEALGPDVRTDEVGASAERLVSGAGHDPKDLNDHSERAMSAVPTADGTTHSEAEFTPWDDVVRGATVFANTTLRLTRACGRDDKRGVGDATWSHPTRESVPEFPRISRPRRPSTQHQTSQISIYSGPN